MDDSIFITIKGMCVLFDRGRAQVDRYRKLPDFPSPIMLSGNRRYGKLLFLKSEVLDWIRSRRLPTTVA